MLFCLGSLTVFILVLDDDVVAYTEVGITCRTLEALSVQEVTMCAEAFYYI